MTSTTMGDICSRAVPQEDVEFLHRIVKIIDENYPNNWRDWEIEDIPYIELFGKTICPKVEAKLRFAIPTREMT